MTVNQNIAQLHMQFGENLVQIIKQSNKNIDQITTNQVILETYGQRIFSLIPHQSSLLSSAFSNKEIQPKIRQNIDIKPSKSKKVMKNQKLIDIERLLFYPLQLVIQHVCNAIITEQDANYAAYCLSQSVPCHLFSNSSNQFNFYQMRYIGGDNLQIGPYQCSFLNVQLMTDIEIQILPQLPQNGTYVRFDNSIIVFPEELVYKAVYNICVLQNYEQKITQTMECEHRPIQKLDEFEEFQLLQVTHKFELPQFAYVSDFTINNLHKLFQMNYYVDKTVTNEIQHVGNLQLKCVFVNQNNAKRTTIQLINTISRVQIRVDQQNYEISNITVEPEKMQQISEDLNILPQAALGIHTLKDVFYVVLPYHEAKLFLYHAAVQLKINKNVKLEQELETNSRSDESNTIETIKTVSELDQRQLLHKQYQKDIQQYD
ncbi:Hypothetical_protein [Hexamita inflata]|uniref:Hypothetical_protein n=1 Tax=Hexamita inflata TaxID=28002 RepID=A0AA86NTF5_9EUKA|nr:Hypothetical protein HINF_LOCUS12155 [Hexamita inflata]